MIKRLLMVDEMNKTLKHGIACFKVTGEAGDESHFFFTKNTALIEYFNEGCGILLEHNMAYDVLNRKTLTLEANAFEGEVYAVGHCYVPSNDLTLKDVKIYIGNKTGAVVISEHMLSKFSDSSMEEFGLKSDDKCFILSACLGIDDNSLEDIYLVNDEGVPA